MENQVAITIHEQLGNETFMMIGGKNLVAGSDYLAFRIGKNAKKVNYCKITLNAMDLYDMEFGWIYGTKYTVKETFEGVYADQMNQMIEATTGMYTRL